LSWYIFVERRRWDKEQGKFVMKVIKKRLRDTQYLIVARGGAKSMYVAFLQAFFLTVDPHTTHQVTVAPTMKQAEEVLSPIKTAITLARGPLFGFLTEGSMNNTTGARSGRQKLASTKRGIENFLTNSVLEIRPMSIDKVQGLRTKYNSVDEWLSGDTRENVMTALMQGAQKFEEPILIAISSEGQVRNGVGDDIKMQLQAILKGELQAPNISIWHYKLDDAIEVKDPRMWVKAQPNLGITVSYETYEQDVAKSEQFPSVHNEIMAKRFGLPMEGFTFFFSYEETQPTFDRLIPDRFDKMPCSLGADLSRGDDFCAFTFLFPLPREEFGIKTRSYITRRTLEGLPGSRRMKYDEFIAEGTLIIMEGAVLDMLEVYQDLSNHWHEHQYDIRTMGYDVYNSQVFVEQYEREWGPFGVVKVPQGARTESVPLGEMKIQANAKLIRFDERILTFTMGHAVTWEDTNGNRKLMKRRHDEKIDNVSAWMDAHVALKTHPEQFE
jgi:phage terminase large subunit-like protein